MVEGEAVRPLYVSESLLAVACLKYGAARLDSDWFNSGVMVLSDSHRTLFECIPTELDAVYLWDQGFLNALRQQLRIPLSSLGYEFNWLGSFNGTNSERRPMNVLDAFMVHATTGLPQDIPREAFVSFVDATWESKGL